MQTDNRLLDDLTRVASGAMGTFQGLREEIAARVRDQVERLLADLDLVTREEFDAVKAMAAEARAENERLAARIAELEGKAQRGTTKRTTTRGASAAKTKRPASAAKSTRGGSRKRTTKP